MGRWPENRTWRLRCFGIRDFLDAVFEFNRGHDTLLDQKLIDLRKCQHHSFSHQALNDVMDQGPCISLHARLGPLLHHLQQHNFRPENIMILKFSMAFKRPHSDFQIVNLNRQFVLGGTREARHQNFVVDDIRAHQLKRLSRQVKLGRRGGRKKRFLPGLYGAVQPRASCLLIEGPGIAPGLSLPGSGRLTQQRCQMLLAGCGHIDHRAANLRHEPLAGFSRDLVSGN